MTESAFHNPDREFELAFNKALRYLGYQARSTREVRRHLEKHKISKRSIRNVLDKLTEYRYVDDLEYARSFVSNRKRTRPKAVFALRYELGQKGISDMIIDQVLDRENDHELAARALDGKWRQWKHLDPEKQKHKVFGFLRNRGFNYEHALSAWEQVKHRDGRKFEEKK